jgi:hypothetical protein
VGWEGSCSWSCWANNYRRQEYVALRLHPRFSLRDSPLSSETLRLRPSSSSTSSSSSLPSPSRGSRPSPLTSYGGRHLDYPVYVRRHTNRTFIPPPSQQLIPSGSSLRCIHTYMPATDTISYTCAKVGWEVELHSKYMLTFIKGPELESAVAFALRKSIVSRK